MKKWLLFFFVLTLNSQLSPPHSGRDLAPISIGAGNCLYAQELPQNILQEMTNPKLVSGVNCAMVKTYRMDAANIGHRTGRLSNDSEAENGLCWVAKTGFDTPHYMVFGPYEDMEQGKYIAFFRLKLLSDISKGEAAVFLDACVQSGQKVLGCFEVLGIDLKKGKYVQVPFEFVYNGGKLECRIYWTGLASLSVDRITLFKMK